MFCLQLVNEEDPGVSSQEAVGLDAPPPYSSVTAANAGRPLVTWEGLVNQK